MLPFCTQFIDNIMRRHSNKDLLEHLKDKSYDSPEQVCSVVIVLYLMIYLMKLPISQDSIYNYKNHCFLSY